MNTFSTFNLKLSTSAKHYVQHNITLGQGHSFWYQSISHIQLPIACQ